jgi:hypothetical protein
MAPDEQEWLAPSAADLKFLPRLPATSSRNFKSKAALES